MDERKVQGRPDKSAERAYLASLEAIPALSPEAERILVARMCAAREAATRLEGPESMSVVVAEHLRKVIADGEDARKRLIEANLRLVAATAHRYRRSQVSLLDLIQEGNAALVHAVSRFDPDRGARLATYATWWVRQSMSRAVADQSRAIRLPAQLHDALGRIFRAQQIFLQEHGSMPSTEWIARRSGVPVFKVNEVLAVNRLVMALEPNDTDVVDEPVVPEQSLGRVQLNQVMTEELASLNEREQEVMRLRFGLDGGEPVSLEAIGRMFGVSKERVRQIEAATLRKLRAPMMRRQAQAFLAD